MNVVQCSERGPMRRCEMVKWNKEKNDSKINSTVRSDINWRKLLERVAIYRFKMYSEFTNEVYS